MSPRPSRRLTQGLLAGLVALGLAGIVAARQIAAADLAVARPWTLAIPTGAPTAAGYLTIENHGAEADRLIAVRSSQAERIDIHEIAVIDGVAKMRPLAEGLVLPPGGTLALEPGGRHLMIWGPRGAWTPGARIPLELDFALAGTIAAEFVVYAPGDAPKPTTPGHAHP